MKRSSVALLALAFAGSAFAQGQGKDPDKKQAGEEYKQAMEKCKDLKDNPKNICEAEAKGRRKVAEAEAKVKDNPSRKNQLGLEEAKADAQYEVADKKCDDEVGDTKKACVKEAKATRDQAKAQARRQAQANP